LHDRAALLLEAETDPPAWRLPLAVRPLSSGGMFAR
jgi:hypothetical protein